MPKIAVFATLKAQPGKGQELADAFSSLYEGPLDAEAGTEVHALHRSKDDPDTVIFYELYSDDDALKSHSSSEALTSVFPKLASLLAGRPEIIQAEPVKAKGLSL
jgi:quinol monooxygenase YgiN